MRDTLQTFIQMRKHANSHVTVFCFGFVGHEICDVPSVNSCVHRPNKTSLVSPRNIWKFSKLFGMLPNVFGFLGFVKSANTKNANPKIRSFNTHIHTCTHTHTHTHRHKHDTALDTDHIHIHTLTSHHLSVICLLYVLDVTSHHCQSYVCCMS